MGREKEEGYRQFANLGIKVESLQLFGDQTCEIIGDNELVKL